MKKIILIGSVSVSVLIYLISCTTQPAKRVDESEAYRTKERYVASDSGLNLRSDPDKSSRLITVIPFGEKVIIEKSDGDEIFLETRYGRWVNVKYGNKTGWLFDGFLCDFKPDLIIKHAAVYYRDKHKKELSSKSGNSANFDAGQISIKDIQENYIVLEAPIPVDGRSIIRNVVWRYDLKEKNFFEYTAVGYYATIKLFCLNKDKYPDLFVLAENAPPISVKIFLETGNEFKEVYNSNDYCGSGRFGDVSVVGLCGDMSFSCYQGKDYFEKTDKDTTYFLRFNNKKEMFEEYEHYPENKVEYGDGTIVSIDYKTVVIKGKKDSKNTSYKFHKNYASGDGSEYIKQFKADSKVSYRYVNSGDKQIILYITTSRTE